VRHEQVGTLLSSLQALSSSRPKLLPDNFTLALIGTLAVASLLPCRGAAAVAVDRLTDVAIALLSPH
jgi:hypothetical protein